jgi:hypothetical protein
MTKKKTPCLVDNVRVVSAYKGRTTIKFWKDIRKDDLLRLELEITTPPKGRHTHQPDIVVKNYRTNRKTRDTVARLVGRLKNLEIVPANRIESVMAEAGFFSKIVRTVPMTKVEPKKVKTTKPCSRR